MLKLSRPPQPQCLAINAAEWTQHYLSARQQDPKHKFRWRSNGCYESIRHSLLAMTQTHCAFCDGLLGAESRKMVEHFRPKTRFPESAYQWHNLFPCCDMCQSLKREQFEEGLLKPDDDDFVFGRYFVANYKTGELIPAPYADQAMQQRALITIQIYGLNLAERNKARIREMEQFTRDPEPLLDDYNYRFFLDN